MTAIRRRRLGNRIVLLWLPLFLHIAAPALPPTWYCPATNCGGVNISYPFRVLLPTSSDDASFCGYSDLNLTCDSDRINLPKLRTKFGDYDVEAFDSNTSTLTLLHPDASTWTGNVCPVVRRNFTLQRAGFHQFDYGGGVVNLTFFYNCSGESRDFIPEEYRIGCLDTHSYHDGKHSYVFVDTAVKPTFGELYSKCCGQVVAPVMRSAVDGKNLSQVFSDALQGGFQLHWQLSNDRRCELCELNNGYCGRDGGWGGSGNLTAISDDFICLCKDGSRVRGICRATGQQSKQSSNWKIIGSTVGVGFVIGLLFLFTCCLRCSVVRKRNAYLPSLTQLFKMNLDESRAIEVFLEEYKSLELKRYTYSELKKMTKSFSEELGHGGFGKVFKGKLKDGQVVAVKLLNESKGSGQEFINEVTSIGRTNHMNVVRLLGFCSEGLKKALLYEFMPNGSLEKFLSNDISNVTDLIQWEDLYKIVIGVSRGLEYLHKGCATRVVHFDIKPHNILLDEDFNPKISDFGLAKLCPSKASIVSMNVPRGTIGYIAPEVFSRNFGVVSSKSDVYSYGMMVLEMIGLRNHRYLRMQSSDTSAYFPQWIYEKFDENGNLDTYGITKDEHAHELIKKMILVGLWCIQTNPIERPSMSKVVEMLDGNSKDLEMPPKPYICSPTMSIEEIESIPMI